MSLLDNIAAIVGDDKGILVATIEGAAITHLDFHPEVPMPTTEYIYNDHRAATSHLVIEDTFSDFGDAATICGAVVTNADLFAEYDLCADCFKADD